HCADNDLAVAVAQTDSKGDRSKRPSEQSHPDYYLRVVERRKNGIVVRGAKMHTSVSVNSNELIVLPTRNFDEADKDYAVAFAVPMNTKGLKLVTSTYVQERDSEFQFPLSAKHRMLETVTIFDDVFVPTERVFLDGEHQFSGALALGFVDYHRFTAVSYKQPLLDLLVGSALLMADYNGISKVGHVRDKLTWLMAYSESVKGLLKTAARECITMKPGLAVPNRLYTNVAKFQFAHNYHHALALVQDITGGLLVTMPAEEDFANPETGKHLEHYLGGRQGVSALDRLRAINMISDLTTSEFGGYHAVLAIHAEGSVEAEKLAIFREFDAKAVMAYAKKMSGNG
ncbi:MAG: gamma-aminobutyrate dehydratase, partial [Chloroflexi bacterium]|nr:gamma-aminobutyrate dehydratase [Chloroflexota bacterium]